MNSMPQGMFGQTAQPATSVNPAFSAGYSQQYVLATGGQLPHGYLLPSLQSKLSAQQQPAVNQEPCGCTAGWLLFGVG